MSLTLDLARPRLHRPALTHLADRSRRRRGPPLVAVAAFGFLAGVAALSARKLGMQGMSAVAGDWMRQLKLEHTIAEGLFKAGLATQDHETGKRTAILGHLAYALLKHGLQEETVIYPAMRETEGAGGKSAAELAAEHFEIKTYLHRLAETPKSSPRWIALWREFHSLVAAHVREEEDVVFPAFHAMQTPKENRRLTLAMNREGIKLA